MRREAEVKLEVLQLVERSPLSVRQTLRELKLAPSTYYRWKRRYAERGVVGLEDHPSAARRVWNRPGDEEPCGYEAPEEARLGRAASLLSLDIRERVMAWWLAVRRRANTPNWDIASTCKIGRARGLLLVEAKAHDKELASDGKSKPRSENGWKNHERIGRAIERADQALERITPGWGLSRDSHYQLSNRFAWAWKLACLGVPVVLVYLGFLKAGEMVDQGQPFEDHKAWEKCLRHHSKDVVPHGAWGQRLDIDGVPLWPLIRTCWLPIG